MSHQQSQLEYLDKIIKNHIKQKENVVLSPEKPEQQKRKIRVKVQSTHNNLPQDFFTDVNKPQKQKYVLQENFQSIDSIRQVKTQATEEELETPTFKNNKSEIDFLFSDEMQSSQKYSKKFNPSPEKKEVSIFEDNILLQNNNLVKQKQQKNANQYQFNLKRFSSEHPKLNSQGRSRNLNEPQSALLPVQPTRLRVMSEDQKARKFIQNSNSQQNLSSKVQPSFIPPIQHKSLRNPHNALFHQDILKKPLMNQNNRYHFNSNSKYNSMQQQDYANEFIRDSMLLDENEIKQEIYRKIYLKNFQQDNITSKISGIQINKTKNNPQNYSNECPIDHDNNYKQLPTKKPYQKNLPFLPPLKHSQSERQHELSAINQQVQQAQIKSNLGGNSMAIGNNNSFERTAIFGGVPNQSRVGKRTKYGIQNQSISLEKNDISNNLSFQQQQQLQSIDM